MTDTFRKISGTLVIIISLFFCYSCNNQPAVEYLIGVSQCSDDAWRTKFNEELYRELLFHPGYSLEIRSANDNNEQQAADID